MRSQKTNSKIKRKPLDIGNNTPGRQQRPEKHRAESFAPKDTSNILKSLVLKSKTALEVDLKADDDVFHFDQVLTLKKIASIAPSIQKKGDNISEILTNAIIDLEELAKQKFKIANLDLRIFQTADDMLRHKTPDIDIYMPYQVEGMESMYSYSLVSLSFIEKKFPFLLPYLYTVIYHLMYVNEVEHPDFQRGEEARAIECYVQSFDEEELDPMAQEEMEHTIKKYEKLEETIYKKKKSVKRYHLWKKERKRFIPEISILMETGALILQNFDKISDYIHRPDTEDSEGYAVTPDIHHRFFYSMDPDDSLWQYLSEVYDGNWREGGSLTFYKAVNFETTDPVFSKTDLPMLLHSFLDQLWNLTHRCQETKKK